MPYIVTTKQEGHIEGLGRETLSVSRRAVATLRGAQQMTYRIYRDRAYRSGARTDDPAWVEAFEPWVPFWPPEQGGSVSLPDGIVIEVEPVNWQSILHGGGRFATRHRRLPADDDERDDAIAAYNAAQEL